MYSVIKDGRLPGLCLLMAGAIIDAVSGTAMSSAYQGDMMVVITPAAHAGCPSKPVAPHQDDSTHGLNSAEGAVPSFVPGQDPPEKVGCVNLVSGGSMVYSCFHFRRCVYECNIIDSAHRLDK